MSMNTSSQPILKIYLVRHGETQENQDGIIQGQLDTKLNEKGLKQSVDVAEVFKGVPLAAAFTSDLERARKTAEIILQKNHPSVRLILQPELRERDMGILQGRKYEHPRTGDLQWETPEDFVERILLWWDAMVAAYNPSESTTQTHVGAKHVLVVSHGAYISRLVRNLLEKRIISKARPDTPERPDWNCPNTSITTIEVKADKSGILEKYSDTAHIVTLATETSADQRVEG